MKICPGIYYHLVWCDVPFLETGLEKPHQKRMWLSWAIQTAFIGSILSSTQISKLRTVDSERVQRLSGIWIHFWINTVTKWNSPNTATAVCSHLWQTPLISYWNVCNPCIIYSICLTYVITYCRTARLSHLNILCGRLTEWCQFFTNISEALVFVPMKANVVVP